MALSFPSRSSRALQLPNIRSAKSFHPPSPTRTFSTLSHHASPRRAVPDETTLAGAQHKPSLSGPSIGHLISELSATTPQMVKEGLRTEGQTMVEEQRTFARRVAMAVIGVPLAIGTGWAAWTWLRGAREGQHELD